MRGALLRHVSPAARVRAISIAAATLFVCACALVFAATPNLALAATDGTAVVGLPFPEATPAQDEKMLVEADQLVYDYDRNTVAAVGNVTIYYARYMLQAEKVSYNKGNGRLIATGSVKLVDPTGAAYYSEYLDITDDFSNGFVQSLRVDTPGRTHFAAARAERSNGETTTFINSTYTACEPCAEHPERPVLWNVKASKIVLDHKEHMVYFTDARLEFFGMPIAWLPYFATADPSVKRKSGFLAPSVGYSARVGASVSAPYYWAPAPNWDMTFTPTVFSRQGVLLDTEFRKRVENGQFTVRAAGIYQLAPTAFAVGSPSRTTFRGGIRSTGDFALSDDWTFGWDGTLLSDRLFSRDYAILNGETWASTSTVHLTGQGDRNFFEARASYFPVLVDPAAAPASDPGLYDQGRQAFVAPVIDYHKIADNQVLGGELSYTSNIANVVRIDDDPFAIGGMTYYHGTAGDTVRVTKELDWEKRIIGPMGQVITPFASLRGDAFLMNSTTAAPVTTSGTALRFMPAVGVEWSLPILATIGGSTHVIEPMAQIIVRPDEMDAGLIPNNDAQSLVFDVSNLFDRDKNSGYDRVEGGTRANVGVRYTGTFSNGASITGAFGQSILLAGANSYAVDPVSNVGAFSGLETRKSDYVGGVALDFGTGPRLTARARFDDQTFAINRGEVQATTALGPVTASAAYLYLRNNPNSGIIAPASVIRGAASVNLAENWRAFGTITYDLAKTSVASDSLGVAFDNECLTLSVAYSEIYASDQPNRVLNFRLALRTFGETSATTSISNLSSH